MKSRKFIKIVLLTLMLVLLSLFVSNTVMANSTLVWNFQQFDGEDAGNAGLTVTHIMGAIINISSIIATGIAIIMLISIGIKYVNAGAGGKAEVKKDLVGYVTGVVILFGTAGILKIIQMFIEANVNNAAIGEAGS